MRLLTKNREITWAAVNLNAFNWNCVISCVPVNEAAMFLNRKSVAGWDNDGEPGSN